MSKRFNNLNLTADQLTNPEFTEADVKSTKIQETQEKVDYATNQSDQVALLGTIVNNTTAEGNSAFNLKYIYRDRIRFNSNNDFEMDDIEGLADSLLSIGMQHNLSAFMMRILTTMCWNPASVASEHATCFMRDTRF